MTAAPSPICSITRARRAANSAGGIESVKSGGWAAAVEAIASTNVQLSKEALMSSPLENGLAKLPRRREPIVRHRTQGPEERGARRRWHRRLQRTRGGRLTPKHVAEELGHGGTVIRKRRGGHLVSKHAHREDVRSHVGAAAGQKFGCRVSELG